MASLIGPGTTFTSFVTACVITSPPPESPPVFALCEARRAVAAGALAAAARLAPALRATPRRRAVLPDGRLTGLSADPAVAEPPAARGAREVRDPAEPLDGFGPDGEAGVEPEPP